MDKENLTESEEHDMYIAQLRDVFEGCDTTGTGQLGRAELLALCDKLQLEDQSEFLVNELLVDTDQVQFDDFKESFINILSKTGVAIQSSDEEEEEEEMKNEEDMTDQGQGQINDDQGQMKEGEGHVVKDEREDKTDVEADSGDSESSIKREVSPKYVVGKKRYGRRSMPFAAEDFESLADDEDDIEVASSTMSLKHSLVIHDLSDTDDDESKTKKKRRKKDGVGSATDDDDDDETETFEAEGQIDHMMADSENLTEEEHYLRGIWNNLKVGQNGYINIQELGRVCVHIGMDEMNQVQLQQLFDKLDADGDGRVSFQEFLNELFQHNTPTHTNMTTPRSVRATPTSVRATPTRSVGATPTRTISAQKKIKFPNGDDRTTPSFVQGSGVEGLFTVLDPEKTGFAKADDIIDLWEKYNVTNGADVLIGLGFDLGSKVNLSELSAGLEQELISADEQNLVYLAAAASFQQEIRHLKSFLEQASWAREKLKLDLAESNARNNLLAKEVDERHASIEKSSESKLLSVEKKYQDQVKQLQGELDREKEHFTQFAAKHKQNIDTEMEGVKQEEGRLREQLLQSQKELEKMGRDLEDVCGKLNESDKLNHRLQRELENVHDLHRKLAEYESQSLMSPVEQKFTQEKLQRLEQDNKDLKDQNDELTAELEQVKQTVPHRKSGGSQDMEIDDDISDSERTPIRKDGSFMSQYIKPVILKKPSYVSPECSDDEMSRSGSAQGRRLPSSPYEKDDISIGSTDDAKDKETIEQLQKELTDVKDKRQTEQKDLHAKFDREMKELKSEFEIEKREIKSQFEIAMKKMEAGFEIEKKDIEQGYRLEVSSVEDRQNKDRDLLVQHLEQEKEKISHEFERLQQAALAELAQELQTTFAHEKEELLRKHNTELHHCEQKYEAEKSKLYEKLQREYEEDLKSQIDELKVKYEQEKFQLEESLAETEQVIKTLGDQNSKLEQKLKRQSEESDKALSVQKAEMEGLLTRHMQKLEDVEKEKREIDVKLKSELNDSEFTHRQEKLDHDNVVGKLNQNIRELQRQKAEMELEFKQQCEELDITFRQEKQEMKGLYEEKIRELEDKERVAERQHEQVLKEGVSSLTGQFKEDFYRLLKEATKQESEKANAELMKGLKQQEKELEVQLDTRKSELNHLFEREKSELVEKYEEQIHQLRQELNTLHERLEEEREALGRRFEGEKEAIEEVLAQQIREEIEEEICQQMEEIRDAYEDEKQEYTAQMDLLKTEIDDLRNELEREEKNRKKIDELNKANKMLQQEKRKVEKGHAELTEALESTKKSLEARIDELVSEKEGAITAVKAEFVESSKQTGKEKAMYDAVLSEKGLLEQQLSNLKTENLSLQAKSDELDESKKRYEQLQQEHSQLSRDRSIPEHAQRAINELTEEKSELEERLVDTESRLAEVNDMAKKYNHLQFDLGQMSIGQAALEETLLDTQERYVDMEAKFNQSEKELKEAVRYKDKYKLIQRKYEDVCKERDRISNLAKNLKEQLNSANSASKEEHEDKGNFTKVLEEKKQLEQQLQRVSDKLLEATTNFAVSQSQHIRQLQQWKEQSNNMVDLEKYTQLQIDLVDNQRSLRDMQEIVTTKEEMSTKVFKENSEKHKETVSSLENQKDSLVLKLKTLQQVLDGQINKFKEQFEAGEKRNALVVDLYKENADLMDALCKVEEQKKDAVSRCYKLEDQCNHLKRMLKKMATVAVN